MSSTEERLSELASALQSKGDDGLRLELVQRARRFKRSWVEMAEGILHVRQTRAFERWGYKDLHAYCATELHIRSATVDKLTGSYTTLKEHAPHVLDRDGVAGGIPSAEAVDYYAKAVDETSAGGIHATPVEERGALLEELKEAVFDQAKPLASLKKRFNPVLHPKPQGAESLADMERALSAARRLLGVLPKIEHLSAKRRDEAQTFLGELSDELKGFADSVRAELDEEKASKAS